MSKGIIVMDISEKCEDCPCCHTDNYDFYCKYNGRHVDWDGKPDWCPIHPLPDRKPPSPYAPSPMLEKAGYFTPYDKGWNDCIEKMGGKDNESDHEIPRK